ESVSFYLPSHGNDDGQMKGAIYQRGTGGASSHSLVAETVTTTSPAPNNWITLNLTTSPVLTNGTAYLICRWGQESVIVADTTGADDFLTNNTTYGAWPDPLSEHISTFYRFSIYAT